MIHLLCLSVVMLLLLLLLLILFYSLFYKCGKTDAKWRRRAVHFLGKDSVSNEVNNSQNYFEIQIA
jgi:hypothetical protein